MSALAAASAAPAEWDLWACLAMASAVVLGAVNFVVGYHAQAGWKSFRQNAWTFRTNLLGLVLLEAAAGLAATWIVVALGLTSPGWLDDPFGWLLLGFVGPALAGASIASFKVGGKNLDLGLSSLYIPLRRMLLQGVDDAFFGAEWHYHQTTEAAYRQRAQERYEAGDLKPQDLAEALRLYRARGFRTPEEALAIDQFLKFIDQTTMSPRDQLAGTVAFLLEGGFVKVLKEVVGEPTEENLKGLSAATRPARAATPPADPETPATGG